MATAPAMTSVARMDRRWAVPLLAVALGSAACSGNSSGGSQSLPSIAAVTPTAAGPSDSSAPSTGTPSTSATPTASTGTTAATVAASPSASTSASSSATSTASNSPSPDPRGTCLTSALTLTLGALQGAAGSQIAPLVFTNVGPTTCTVQGYPGVSFVTGDSGSQVGVSATRTGGGVAAVSLVPKATAEALVRIGNTENYPVAACAPVTVRGLRVYPPGRTAALFVALPDGTTACSMPPATAQLSVQPVMAAG